MDPVGRAEWFYRHLGHKHQEADGDFGIQGEKVCWSPQDHGETVPSLLNPGQLDSAGFAVRYSN